MATEEVVKVIQKGGIPVLSWRKGAQGRGSSLVVEDVKEGAVNYIAVSHVWADGLGNPHENSLPICQLDRIQAAIDAVLPEAENFPARFWMDTLCIPVADEHKSLRKASIKMMRQIYRHAEAVLIFDSGLQRLSLSATVNEKSIALYMSNWLHRLWTFQEGMLAKAMYFQLKESSLCEGDLDKAEAEEQKVNKEKGLYGSFLFSARGAATGHFIILRDFVDMKLAEDAVLFPPLCHAVQQRSTTRISDETICAATILEMNMDDILAVETRDVPDEIVAETRMEIFLKQIGEFAPAIIFHHQKCLQREGYRWAPKTLMGAAQNDFIRGITEKLSSFKGKGLRVRYPGLVFQSVPQGSEKEITVVMKHNEHRFRLRLFPEDADALPLWDPTAVYAVIMFEAISARYPTGTDVIVGILKDYATLQRGARLDIRREHRAWLEPVGLAVLGGAESQGSVVAEMLSGSQRWRVL
ncbi:hypothetical protein BDZ94DRAFT_1305863 [Collybia nuda]|uniref:Heterokaryon incompatibility domain-containing protein n=1 Tax=Collybia nuda TaxID=64659 RepID=A0A9P6CM64_9AGAR|nr:hypothetical protein BDZ94DRAFT_1305863 [Collybia nuda]